MNAIIAFAAFLVGMIAGGVIAYNAGYEIGFMDAKRLEIAGALDFEQICSERVRTA